MDTSTGPVPPRSAGSPGSPGSDPRQDPPPRLPAWVRVLIPTVLFLPAAMAASLVLDLIPGFAPLLGRMDGVGLAAYTVSTTATLAAYVLLAWALLRWVDRRPLRDLGLRPNGRALLALLIGYIIAQAVSLLGSWGVQTLGWGRAIDVEAIEPEMAQASFGVMLALVVLRSFVLQGIGEEVLFRGYLLQSLRSRPVLAVLITAVAFTIPHLASGGGQQSAIEHLYFLAIPFGFSLSAGFLAIALRSIWAAAGIHGGFHFATGVTASFGIVADGPAAWMVLGALHAVAGVVIALLIPRRRWDEVRAHGPYASIRSSKG